MTWVIAVRHRTGFQYGGAVVASYNEARMTPATGAGQQTLEARLQVTPGARPLRYRDYWGTVVDAFDVHVPHSELVVTATAVVETAGARPDPPPIDWSAFSRPDVADRYAELLLPSRLVVPEPEVEQVADGLMSTYPPAEACRQAAAWAHQALTYTRGATGVHTTSAEARTQGKGVCQDYAHLTLAVARAMGVPARYVSGYLHPERDAALGEMRQGESHAWVECWAGDWLPLDPTSLVPVAERHVVVARGRDYSDVRPLSGVYSGPTADSLQVAVELRRLR